MVSKGITLLEQSAIFNDDIREWRRKLSDLKTWVAYKVFFHHMHRKQRLAVRTTGKGGYTAAVKNIYVVMPPAPPEEKNADIEPLQAITQGLNGQR